jgi:hypothetical protein
VAALPPLQVRNLRTARRTQASMCTDLMLAAGISTKPKSSRISTASRSGWTGVASSQTHQDTGERVARKCGMRPKAGSAFRSSVLLLGE